MNQVLTTHGALEVDGVSAGYGDGVVISGVRLDVPHGRCSVLLGRNGVGKSTLARCIAGTLPTHSGRISFAGSDVTGRSADELARLGLAVLPQGKRVFPSLTVAENLQLGRMTLKRRQKRGADTSLAWSTERILELFPIFAERLRTRAGSLSGGEQQMLAIARLMIGGPAALVLDEPSEALSPLRVKELGRLLAGLRDDGMSILLVEQNVGFAIELADDVYVMDKGTIVLHSSGDQIAHDRDQVEALLTL